MIRQRWLLLGVLGLAAAAVWARAQTTEESFEQRMLAPEIWRLPPVNDFPSLTPSGTTESPVQLPTALVVPQYELLPAPKPETAPPETDPAAGNAPATALDMPIVEEHIKIKPEKVKIWSGSFNLGMDGSEGNTEAFNLNFASNLRRKTDRNVLTMMLDYKRQTSKTVATEERLYFDGRYEQLLELTRWTLFYHQTVEYDKFQPFDVRDTSDIGVGFRIIDRENATFIGRFGGGFSHEYGGEDDGQYTPEAVFGLQLERQINNRQKFIGTMEYAPEAGDFNQYRLRTQAAWEVLLDADKNLHLRMGVLDRYNSKPNNARKNDLDYALMIMWKF